VTSSGRVPRARILALVALTAGCAGCASWLEKVSYFDMAPRLEYQGFSFDRPPNANWYLLRSEESHTDVTLRRDFAIPSRTHTFYARVALGSLPERPISHEAFAKLAEPGPDKAPYDVREDSRRVELVSLQGQWCIRYELTDTVHGAPVAPDRDLVLIVRGFRCLHPAFPRAALGFFYSERGLPEEIDPELSEEGEAFLRGVRIDVAPGKAAAGGSTLPPASAPSH
jgi:hypothetical protein